MDKYIPKYRPMSELVYSLSRLGFDTDEEEIINHPIMEQLINNGFIMKSALSYSGVPYIWNPNSQSYREPTEIEYRTLSKAFSHGLVDLQEDVTVVKGVSMSSLSAYILEDYFFIQTVKAVYTQLYLREIQNYPIELGFTDAIENTVKAWSVTLWLAYRICKRRYYPQGLYVRWFGKTYLLPKQGWI